MARLISLFVARKGPFLARLLEMLSILFMFSLGNVYMPCSQLLPKVMIYGSTPTGILPRLIFMKRDPSATFTLSAGIGTISAGQNSSIVSHPLGSVPSSVHVSPSDGCEAPIEVPIAGITDSEFVVRFVGGVTLDTDAKFMWVVLS